MIVGGSEIDQLFKMFRLFGTPDVSVWQGVHDLPHARKTVFPTFKVNGKENLRNLCKNYQNNKEVLDLLSQMLQLEPSKRITLKAAMQHPFFAEYNGSARESSMERVSLPSLSPQKHRSLVKASP